MLRLGKLTDYAVVILGEFVKSPKDKMTASLLAKRTGLPAPTVAKVLKLLAQGNITIGQRGSQGGYGLARPAPQITVADIIGAMEGPIALTDCVSDAQDRCAAESFCSLHGNWETVNRTVQQALSGISLVDMVKPMAGTGFGMANHASTREETAHTSHTAAEE